MRIYRVSRPVNYRLLPAYCLYLHTDEDYTQVGLKDLAITFTISLISLNLFLLMEKILRLSRFLSGSALQQQTCSG